MDSCPSISIVKVNWALPIGRLRAVGVPIFRLDFVKPRNAQKALRKAASRNWSDDYSGAPICRDGNNPVKN